MSKEGQPADILYSLPTVCDPLPALDVHADERGRMILHEDDWRTVELVDVRLVDVVVRQFDRIRDVVRHHARRGPDRMLVGFDAVHVRRDPADPLPGGRPRRLLLDPVGPSVGGVGFFGEPGVVPGSFAVPLGAGVLYGLADGAADDEVVRVLGVDLAHAVADGPAATEAAAGLAELMVAHDLRLVDWCRTLLVGPDGATEYVGLRSGSNGAADL